MDMVNAIFHQFSFNHAECHAQVLLSQTITPEFPYHVATT